MKTKVQILGLLLLISSQTFAQFISGRLTDDAQHPVEFANVVLLSLPDSSFIQGTVTSASGSFQLSSGGKSEHLLRISCIGYTTFYQKCMVGDIGTISLSLDTQILDEVVVKASLPATRLRGDALVTNVQSGVLAKAGSGIDVLDKIPGITRKEKGLFEVFGKGVPLIYINGRQVRDNSELESLRSEDIKEVEVITNPGAKYDATVQAVIRVKTIKRQGDGFGFNLRSSYSQWDQTDLMEEVNLNYRKNGLDIFGSYVYSYTESYRLGYLNQTTYADKRWVQDVVMREPNKRIQQHRIVTGLNYQLADNHSVGARYTYEASPARDNQSTSISDIRTDNKVYDHLYTVNDETVAPVSSHRLNLYYTGKANDLEIDFNADYYTNKSNLSAHITEESEKYEDREVQSLSLVNNDLLAAKLILSYPLLDGSFTWGGEYTHTKRNDDYLTKQSYVPTSYSLMKESNISAFAEYRRKLHFGQLSASVRYEHVEFNYFANGERVNEQSRKYDNWFPNLSFSATLGKVQTQLSYTVKTQRPTYRQLSNSMFYANRFTYETGNPGLKPAIFHNITLDGSWKFLHASVSYQMQKSPIFYWNRLMENTPGASVFYYVNLNKLPSLQTMISATPEFGCWLPRFTIGFQKQWFSVVSGGETLSLNKPLWSFDWSNTFKMPGNYLLNVDYFTMSTGHSANMYTDQWRHRLGVSIRKGFFHDALNVTLGMRDILYKQSGVGIAYTPNIRLWVNNQFDTREVYVTLRYTFNAGKDKYKGTGAGAETLRRL